MAERSKEFLTSIEVAELLGVHQTTVIRWMDAGKLAGYRTPGGHRRFAPEVVRTFMVEYGIPDPDRVDPASAEVPRVQVLLVDDEPRIIGSFCRYFEESRLLEVEGATSGGEALLRLARRPPQVAVIDLAMPGISGFEVIETLRADPELRDVSVIVLSGELTKSVKQRLEGLQVDSVLAKPTTPDKLQDAILGEVLPKLLRPVVAIPS